MAKTIAICAVVVATLCLAFVNTDGPFYQEKSLHQAQELTDQQIAELSDLADQKYFRAVLDKILVPRVVGTANHKRVGDFIITEMKKLGWDTSEDTFTDSTPIGNLNFRNIVAKLNPQADRYLMLACHYDSKYYREHAFVGATDSAVPCAMMINLAKVMAKHLNNCKNRNLSLMFVFFDGEEAFREWSDSDSVYGARNLAKKWQATPYKDNTNELHRIDLFVLLDLLGAPDPVFYSYFKSTERWYVLLAQAEQRLANMNKLTGYSVGKAEQTYFRLRSSRAAIEDDHVPFLRRNVDVLHVIPNPFPPVWHTPGDDLSALDFNTIENLNKVFRVFVAAYLNIF
ncbi:glutaminyl-peptide cyclotransferase [Hyposmocoma kahamanoa]|uniref:glutaminyl-peptide cyclotransferase n=1 Tax=Hyposmocoma kahamanoa TaxID=1477025 RepID=UPI000E6D9472|nr:glutaminyl-peptide cyclotransferase [Hyposmocoma kahamanoa]